jgi:hypothetical protein
VRWRSSFPPRTEIFAENFNEIEVVDQTGASWNQIALWLRELDHLRPAA